MKPRGKWHNAYTIDGDHTVLTITRTCQGKTTATYRVLLDNQDVAMVEQYHWRLDPKGYVGSWWRHGEVWGFVFLHRLILAPPETRKWIISITILWIIAARIFGQDRCGILCETASIKPGELKFITAVMLKNTG